MKNNLKKYRLDNNFTQIELSQKSGISRQLISAIEKGRYNDLKISTVESLSKVLEASPSEIFPSLK